MSTDLHMITMGYDSGSICGQQNAFTRIPIFFAVVLHLVKAGRYDADLVVNKSLALVVIVLRLAPSKL